jgi:hypothetical protein
VELIELGALGDAQYAALVRDEHDPWGVVSVALEWRPKDRDMP